MQKWVFTLIPLMLVLITACGDSKSTETKRTMEGLKAEYRNKGLEITAHAFQTLSAELQGAMKSGGVVHAIKYCHLQASPLIDSLSKLNDLQIKRTSHKIRNTENTAEPREMDIIESYLKMSRDQKLPEPKVDVGTDRIYYYAPIIVIDKCLRCHGQKDLDISKEDYAVILNHYPKDRAHGFKVGELRGIWSLQFNR